MIKEYYDEHGKKIIIKINWELVGSGLYGTVYQIDNNVCLKHISYPFNTNKEIIKEFMKLDLPSFYKIYKLLFDKYNEITGYIMKYYKNEEIDIMTMPIEYTLDNLASMLKDIRIISEKNILVEDAHTDNVILNNDRIIIIDVDNYSLSQRCDILNKNIYSIYSLFQNIYVESMLKYYEVTNEELIVTRKLFYGKDIDYIYNELSNYKYPIEYVRKKSLEPIKYVMKKDIEY